MAAMQATELLVQVQPLFVKRFFQPLVGPILPGRVLREMVGRAFPEAAVGSGSAWVETVVAM